MSGKLQYPPALWAGVAVITLGTGFMFIGEVAVLIGLALYAVGLGSLAAAFTKV